MNKLILTLKQEKIYTELLQQQLNANSWFELYIDDEDYIQYQILEKLELVKITEILLFNRCMAFVFLNKSNVRFDLAPKFVK